MKPTPPPLPKKTLDEILAEIEEERLTKELGDRTLPSERRPPSKKVINLIHNGVCEKSLRYHIAFWGAIIGTGIGGIIAYFGELKGMGQTFWIVIGFSLASELLLIRIARRLSDQQLRKDLCCVYWREMDIRYSLRPEKTIPFSPAINLLSLLYGFYSVFRIAAVCAIFMLAIAFMFLPSLFLLIFVFGGAIYGGFKLCKEMIADSKWINLRKAVIRAAYS